MEIEDTLELYERRCEEIEELLSRAVILSRVRKYPSWRAAQAYLRFEDALAAIRELEEFRHQAQSDLRIAWRRIVNLFGRRIGILSVRFELRVIWIEIARSCYVYWLYARRVLVAARAAQSLIFLH